MFQDERRTREPLPSRPPTDGVVPHDHMVQFYDDEEALVQRASAFLAGGLLAGGPAVVISRGDRLPQFRRALASMGVDVDAAERARQVHFVDARSALDGFMTESVPDEARFRDTIGGLISTTVEAWRPRRLRAFGDMVDLLWTDARDDAALRLEDLWNDLAARYDFALHCAYDQRHFREERRRSAFDAVCDRHGQILPIEPRAAF